VSEGGYYAVLDNDNGYFQIANHVDDAEIFSFLSDYGIIYTPTRLVQGCTDGVAVYQSSMMEVLGPDLLKICALWIDDVIVFARTPELLIERLRRIFLRYRRFNVRISPDKTVLLATEVEFCGKEISAAGIRPNAEYVQGIVSLPEPTTVRALQQFLAGANWLRNYIFDYARIFHPLQLLLLSHTSEAGTLKGSKLSKLPLNFTKSDSENFLKCKAPLLNCAQMASPRKGYRLQLLTDASDLSWSIVLTQVIEKDLSLPVQDRFHEPLVFLSGNFSGSQLRWSVVEKECYPIIHALDKLSHFLKREDGFQMFCDHRNLIFMLSPSHDLVRLHQID